MTTQNNRDGTKADHGEASCKGSGKIVGRLAISRAVSLIFDALKL